MKKMSLVIILALVLSMFLSVSILADSKPITTSGVPGIIMIDMPYGQSPSIPKETEKLSVEKYVPICSELFLKKGTIIRTSNFAILTNTNITDKYQPKYTTIYGSYPATNTIVVRLEEDMHVYLSFGGLVTNYFNSIDNYMKSLIKFVENKNITYSTYEIDEKESLRILLGQSDFMKRYYMSIGTEGALKFSELKNDYDRLQIEHNLALNAITNLRIKYPSENNPIVINYFILTINDKNDITFRAGLESYSSFDNVMKISMDGQTLKELNVPVVSDIPIINLKEVEPNVMHKFTLDAYNKSDVTNVVRKEIYFFKP